MAKTRKIKVISIYLLQFKVRIPFTKWFHFATKFYNRILGNIARVNTTEWAEKNDWNPVLLFDKFFNEDIGQLLKMSKLWEKDGRKKPSPLVYKDLVSSYISIY